MKLLITWLGYNQDFTVLHDGLQINTSGFTTVLHHDIYTSYRFDKHILITGQESTETIRRCKMLTRFLKDQYPTHLVEVRHLPIVGDDLQNYEIIESAIRSFLQTFTAEHELYVVAGTGPTLLPMAWSYLWLTMEQPFKLHLMRRPEHGDGKKRTLLEVRPHSNQLLDNKLREYHFNKEVPREIYLDELVEKEYEKANMIARAIDVNVLILGETGCGKDVLAKHIYNCSPLKGKPYMPINCASLPDELLYSELFGHEKGAFTGAVEQRKGIFEECNGGTLFLDEIGDISSFMQQSLLRALENREIKRLGTNEVKKNINVRILAATNADLYDKCKSGKFRWDLYYRLCSMEIDVAPYRYRNTQQRAKAIAHYWQIAEAKWGKRIAMDEECERAMANYRFPGNFREIKNTINGLFALGKDNITVGDLPKRFFFVEQAIDESYDMAMKKHSIKIYQRYNKNMSATCKALGHSNPAQLKKKFEKWGIL